MVDAKDIVPPPFTLFILDKGELAIHREGQILRIYAKDRVSEVVEDTVELRQSLKQKASKEIKCFGIFGQIKLRRFEYLVVITEAELIGQLFTSGSEILKVGQLLYIPLGSENLNIPAEDQSYVDMLQTLQNYKSFYFSYNLDLTKGIQKQIEELVGDESPEQAQRDFLLRKYPNSINYVHEYAFNHNMLYEFKELQHAPFRVPVIYGYVGIASISAQQTFILISRKDSRRPGRRFVVRGLDKEGNAANFCETEHIITQNKKDGTFTIAAHMQIRGSIPLIWNMKPTMKYTPSINVNTNFDESYQAALKHIDSTTKKYNKQYFVNLIDKKGSQDRIGKKFTEMVDAVKNASVSYVWFDFHGECKNMKWENLSRLVAIVKKELLEHGHFMADLQVDFGQRQLITSETCKIRSTQSGVMRTNCIDCLDRTNVVQSVFSRQIAHIQLAKMGLSQEPKGQPFEVYPNREMEQAFRNIWTDNADALSTLYSGTPALKTDFTRTGKRSIWGAIDDGKHSAIRYYINNFCDGYNHDCLDLSQGRIKSDIKLRDRGFLSPLKIALIVLFGSVYATTLAMNVYFPVPEENPHSAAVPFFQTEQFRVKVLHHLFSIGVFLLGALTILTNGKMFVDEPTRDV